jgi:hypothetical protein
VVAFLAGPVGEAPLFTGVVPLAGNVVLAGGTLFALVGWFLAGAAFVGEFACLGALSLIAFSLDPLS